MDDQPANLRLLKEVLTPAGFEVREARSGAEALAVAQESMPSLVLLDMHLPDMHGLEVLRRLRESSWGASLRVVAMSALASAEDAALWSRAGCVGTIQKPIAVKTFVHEISRWIPGAVPPSERVEKQEGKKNSLGEILVVNALITPEQLDQALRAQAESGKRLGQILVEQGHVSEDDIAWALGNQLGYPYVFLSPDIIDKEAASLLPERFLRERRVLPILKFGQEMTLAMADPTDQQTVDEVVRQTGLQVKRSLALASNIEEMLDRLFSPRPSVQGHAVATEAQYLQFHLVQALEQGASEIHFDPTNDGQARVRYRLQGVLVDRAGQPEELHAAILCHLRDLTGAGEKPVEHAAAAVTAGEVEVHLAATFLPTAAGPAATVALYPRRTSVPDLEPFGVSEERLRPLRTALQAPRGVVMVGCGEALLRSTLLNTLIPPVQRGKVWALETLPVYRRPTLNQTILRSPDEVAAFVRAAASANADLIVVDDISRREALVAACEVGRQRLVLAGHPQDDAVGLVSQALDAAGPGLVASTLQGVVAARTARLLCPSCKQASQQSLRGFEGRQTFTALGCEVCGFTGFRGQRVLLEVWMVDGDSRALLRSGQAAACEQIIQEVGPQIREQSRTLLEDGLTSLDELARVVDGLKWISLTSSS